MNASNLWEGNVKATIIPEVNAIDIDNEYDFRIIKRALNPKEGTYDHFITRNIRKFTT